MCCWMVISMMTDTTVEFLLEHYRVDTKCGNELNFVEQENNQEAFLLYLFVCIVSFRHDDCFAMSDSRKRSHFGGWFQDIFSPCQEIRRVHSGHLHIYTNTSIYNYATWSNNEQNSLFVAVRRAFAYRGNVEQLTVLSVSIVTNYIQITIC